MHACAQPIRLFNAYITHQKEKTTLGQSLQIGLLFTEENNISWQEEAQIAVEQLAALSRPDPPRFPLGQLNPKPLKAARVSYTSLY